MSTMQAATADWAEFAPPQPPAQVRALALAIVAHVLLLGALAWGVNWRRTDVTLTVEAELWSAVPQQAAPRLDPTPAPPPPAQAVRRRNRREVGSAATTAGPGPRDADIALARQKQEAEALAAKQKLELEHKRRLKLEADQKEAKSAALEQKRLAQEKLDKERQKKVADDKKATEKKLAQEAQRRDAAILEAQKREEDARAEKELKAQREANLRRMAGLAGATGGETSTGAALHASAPSASYAGKVAATVKRNIVFTEDLAGNPTAEVEVRTSPDGSILSRKLTKSSGSKAWDDAVIKAIDKTDKLPRDTDGRVPSALVISFRPKD